jgi:hypothetical protein
MRCSIATCPEVLIAFLTETLAGAPTVGAHKLDGFNYRTIIAAICSV